MRTIQETIDLVRPKIQNKGAVTGSVSFDLSAFTHYTLSITADITIDLQNAVIPQYAFIEVVHTTAGTKITNLPGSVTWDFAWATGAGDRTLLIGSYNGATWLWRTGIFQTVVILNAPTSFAAAAGTLSLDLSWVAATNATYYIVDRATNSIFTTGVINGVYNDVGTSFTDTGLSAATQYYYRISSFAPGFQNSVYATCNGTTL